MTLKDPCSLEQVMTNLDSILKSRDINLLINVHLVKAMILPRRKSLLISWLQSPSAVILEPPQNKVCHCFHCFPTIFHDVMGLDAMIFVFWMLSFKPTFSLSSFTVIKRLFSSSLLSAIREWYHLHIWGYWYFSQQSWFQLVLLPDQCFSWGTLRITYKSTHTHSKFLLFILYTVVCIY